MFKSKVIICSVLLLTGCNPIAEKDREVVILEKGFKKKYSSLHLNKRREHDFMGKPVITYSGKSKETQFRASVYKAIEPEKATEIIKVEITRLENAFRSHLMPYEGQISKVVDCYGKRPEIIRNETSDRVEVRVQMPVNDRFAVSACNDNGRGYLADIWLLHCMEFKTLAVLKYYSRESLIGEEARMPVACSDVLSWK